MKVIALPLVLVLTWATIIGVDVRQKHDADRHASALTTALVQAEIRVVLARRDSISWCAPVEAMDWLNDELRACHAAAARDRVDGQWVYDDLERCKHARRWEP